LRYGGEIPVDFVAVETSHSKIKLETLQIREFEAKQFLVPVRPSDRTIHHQPKRLHLRFRPLIAKNHRHFRHGELLRCFQAQMAIHDLAITARKHRNLEAELANRRAHSLDRVVVLARIARVRNQPVDRPHFSLRFRRLRHLSSICPHRGPASHISVLKIIRQ
jgi:hypothetical protein